MHRKFLGSQDRKNIYIYKLKKKTIAKKKKVKELHCYLSIAVKLFVIRFLSSSSKTKTIFISSCKQMKRLKHCVTLSVLDWLMCIEQCQDYPSQGLPDWWTSQCDTDPGHDMSPHSNTSLELFKMKQ